MPLSANGGVRTVVAIGNFDGVHVGHQRVLRDAADLAARDPDCALAAVVLTFSPHPASLFGRPAPALLTRAGRKATLCIARGIARTETLAFTREFAELSPEDFARQVLATGLRARHVVVGHNFRFGHQRVGDVLALTQLGQLHGFEVHVHEIRADAQGPISSTRVRAELSRGEVERASALLGRPHTVSGVVEHGFARGRTLGFPTANVSQVSELLPAHGVYAAKVYVASDSGDLLAPLADAVVNIGVRPTLHDSQATRPSVEAHLLEFDRDLYGATLGIALVARIRGEQKFESLPALRAQIALDAQAAKVQAAAAAWENLAAPNGLT